MLRKFWKQIFWVGWGGGDLDFRVFLSNQFPCLRGCTWAFTAFRIVPLASSTTVLTALVAVSLQVPASPSWSWRSCPGWLTRPRGWPTWPPKSARSTATGCCTSPPSAWWLPSASCGSAAWPGPWRRPTLMSSEHCGECRAQRWV